MVFNRKLNKLFDKNPLKYHSSRRGYPEKVFSDILRHSKIKKGAKILDIGCGSGLSTSPLVSKGYNLTGIDISDNMIEVAKKNSKNNEKIRYIVGKFESYKFENDFDLIISGQAFHWLNEKVAYKKCFRILNHDGFIAIFGKFNDYKKSKFLYDLRKLFIKYCKYYPLDLNQKDYIKDYVEEIKSSNFFEKIWSKKYSHSLKYNGEDYRDFILSNSWIIKLDEKTREIFMEKVDRLLNKYKWPMNIPFGTALIMAKVKK